MRVRLAARAAVLLGLLAGVVWAEGGGGKAGAGPAGPPARPPQPVKAAPVVARSVREGRSFVGSVEPTRRSVVGSEFAGLVTALLVRQGDRVEEKQPVAKLSTAILDLDLAAARAELALRTERLRELQNGSRPEEVQQSRARVAQQEADLELKTWRREAAERLYSDHTISEDQLRDARLQEKDAGLLVDAAKAALALVVAGPREEEVAQAKAQVDGEQATVDRLEEQRSRYEIKAPFGGWVVAERTEEGEYLSVGAPVVEIVALDQVDVVVQVPEDFVGGLVEETSVRVEIDALARRMLTGKIHRIVPQADVRGRTFPVLVRLDNERVGDEPLIKAGMFARTTLAVGQESQGIFVPKDAVVLGGPQPVVWVIDPKTSVAHPVAVVLGAAVDDLVEVKGELEAGVQVVTRGNERLFPPAAPVQVQD